MSEDKKKNYLFGIILAITITISVVIVGSVIYVNYTKDMENAPQTNQTITNTNSTNTTGISGNVTSVQELENGTLLLSVNSEPSEKKELKYQNNVVQSILNDAEKFSNVCLVQITTKNDSDFRVVYEKPNSEACKLVQTEEEAAQQPQVNETVVTSPVVNETQQQNVTQPQANITQQPIINKSASFATTPTIALTAGKVSTVILTGDVDGTSSGTAIFNQIKARNADRVVVLGDLGYDSDLKWFKSTYGTLGNKLSCVVGNHDSPEDGTSSIYTETKKLCGEPYYFKINNVLFIGVDTNGDIPKQQTQITALLGQKTFMTNITSVHIMSHKPCAVPSNAHHPVEAKVKVFCDAVLAKKPNAFFDQAHNHVLSESANQQYKTTGAGGRSHYTCSTSSAFPFCNGSSYGFLEYTIQPDGNTTRQFIDFNGKVLR